MIDAVKTFLHKCQRLSLTRQLAVSMQRNELLAKTENEVLRLHSALVRDRRVIRCEPCERSTFFVRSHGYRKVNMKNAHNVQPVRHPHLELENSVNRAAMILELLGDGLSRRIEDERDEKFKGGCLAAGLINIVHEAKIKLLTDYEAAHAEWRELYIATKN